MQNDGHAKDAYISSLYFFCTDEIVSNENILLFINSLFAYTCLFISRKFLGKLGQDDCINRDFFPVRKEWKQIGQDVNNS